MNTDEMSLVTQHIIMSRDLNAHGNLFGGVMMAWIDEAAAIFGMNHIQYTNIVTVNIDDVNFKTPGRNGDIVQIYAKIEKYGRTSFVVHTSALTIGMSTHVKREIINCKVTFVCLDEMGRAFPFFEIHKERFSA
jgi:acyl-CoA thioesterase YciA